MRILPLAFVLSLVWTISSASAGSSNSLLDVSRDGTLLACSNRDSGTVTIVRLPQLEVLHEVPVGHKPEGVTFLGDTHRLAVAVYADDAVKFLDADAGDVTAEAAVFDEPYGVVSSPDGSVVYATLDYPGQVVELDGRSASVRRTIPVGKFTRGCAVTADGRRLFVTEYYTGVVKEVDLAAGTVASHEWKGSDQDNLARQIVLHPSRPKAYLPHQRSVVTNPQGTGAIFPYVAVVDTNVADAPKRKRVQMDSFRGTYVVANPWEVDLTPDGRTLFAVFSGTNDMFACKVLDDNYRELEYDATVQLGSNPRAVRVSPDGEFCYVYNALDFNVVAYHVGSLQPVKTVQVCDCPLDAETLLGKKLFYVATQPMVGRRWISCSSCHPDGDPDGRTWQQPEGLRNTQSLAGMAWTHPIHWSADRDEVQDFEHTIRSPLMQGRGLVKGKLNDSLKEPNSGLSPELDAVAVYSNSHSVPLSPYAKDGLSEAAQRGKSLFFDEAVGCAKCHSGPYLCDSRPGPAESFTLHNVGTGEDDPSEKMGPKFDTPTLLGIYRTAPYLHHGKAATLRDVLTTHNRDDRHGKTSHLSDRQIDDLVEFLKALPYKDPTQEAEDLGLTRISK
jgi:DNA-binding beta-propeller fold protein YncE